mmetsp:Transcript_37726/g.107257  ORF Transcript_37726/g.107257 Transcript_37726/m.107257 type:complete len:181 (+) Transcript_37726:158-700(+)|eukprot:CAMPEP_0176226994 /NCGR_PEP_ID=MMETSP0121_2-20121125/22544_1 /TAXON_ID=160619 /ORGANISM="Kryptoperidinium foliaceum, Strain CCMP 1326" /LENGTH=180 /DNA_ID=CAMNT_0017566271 /DNA_START=156 /DNA_END=698 /DNA_ORIENTATION=+
MGQTGSSGEKAPARLVPTSTQIRRAQTAAGLTSKWWALEAEGQVPAPLCLQTFGKEYAALSEQHCGQHRHDHQRCIKHKKLDPLSMSAWYPQCGEPYELESACVGGLLGEIDKRCQAPLEAAATAVRRAGGNFTDQRLSSALEGIGQCLAKVAKTKGVAPQYDAEGARKRFVMSKDLLTR